MKKTIEKKNIPEIGDMVTKVQYTKARDMCMLTFDNGRKVIFSINPEEFGKKKKSEKECATVESAPPDNENLIAASNTPADEVYREQAIMAMIKMDGKDPTNQDVLQEYNIRAQATHQQEAGPGGAVIQDEAMTDKIAAVLERSESRTTTMAEGLSSSAGQKRSDMT